MKAAQHTSYNKNNIALNLTDIAKPHIKPGSGQSDRSRCQSPGQYDFSRRCPDDCSLQTATNGWQ